MKIIPYTLIAFKHNYTKALLETLYYYGFCFEKIIVVIHQKYLGQIRNFEEQNKKALSETYARLYDKLELSIPFFEDCDFSKYSSCIETIDVFPFYPQELKEKLQQDTTYFFSYVGLVPQDFLAKAKWLHIHPGIIPPVRGSDCLFWSLLWRGRPGYSLFYLNDGIDNGQIIYQNEFTEELPSLSKLKINDISVISRGILNYYDTYLRAKLFVQFLEAGGG